MKDGEWRQVPTERRSWRCWRMEASSLTNNCKGLLLWWGTAAMNSASRRRSAPNLTSAMSREAWPSLSIARATCFGGASAEDGGLGFWLAAAGGSCSCIGCCCCCINRGCGFMSIFFVWLIEINTCVVMRWFELKIEGTQWFLGFGRRIEKRAQPRF